MFFSLQPAHSVLSDINPDLINCYSAVRDEPEQVIGALAALRNTEAEYYRVRDEWTPSDPVERAAQLIYLTSLSFNGIHRTNLKGKFNVPYGRRTHIEPLDPNRIRAVSEALQTAEVICADFEQATASVGPHDLVYLDPPYTVAHNSNGFVRYNSQIFAWSDQLRLARLARELVDRGAYVIVSNADHESVTSLYEGFQRRTIQRSSTIAASSEKRGSISECIFYCNSDLHFHSALGQSPQ
jgi:DNA adenine methylase